MLRDTRPFALRLPGSRGYLSCSADSADQRPQSTARCDTVLSGDALSRLSEASPRASETGRAVVDLVAGAGDAATLERVVAVFENHARRDSTSAEAWTLVAVARFARAQERQAPLDLFAALDAITRAALLDSLSPVIAFNRAVVLQEVHLRHLARDAWGAYATTRDRREWKTEAADWASRLDDPAVQDIQSLRELLMDSVLPAWGESFLGEEAQRADAVLHVADSIARLMETSGERGGLRAIEELLQAAPSIRRRTASGLMAYRIGLQQYRAENVRLASRSFREAAESLRAIPLLGGWAELYVAGADVQLREYAVAERRFRTLAFGDDRPALKALTARARAGLALSLARRGLWNEAMVVYDSAASQFQLAGEWRNRAAIEEQQAELLHLSGQSTRASRHLHAALVHLDRDSWSGARHAALVFGGIFSGSEGFPAAAIEFLREAVTAADKAGMKVLLSEVRTRLADAQATLGRRDEASANLTRARAGLVHVLDSTRRAGFRAGVDAAEGRLLSSIDASRALHLLDSAAWYHRNVDSNVALLLPILHDRGRLLATSDSIRAMAAFREIVDIVERQAAGAEAERAAALRSTNVGSYHVLIAAAVARGDSAAALRLSMASRGVIPRAGVESLSNGEAMVWFDVLPDQVVAWVFAGGGWAMRATRVNRDSVSAWRVAFVSAIRGNRDSATRTSGSQLHRVLIAPVRAEIASARSLRLFLPAELEPIPFAALRDGPDAPYLVEAVSLTVSRDPFARRRDSGVPRTASTVIVGDIPLDRALTPDLAPLPGSVAEVEAIRRIAANSTPITGAEATPSTVMNALRSATMFHFAGHARSIPWDGARSHIVLAASGHDGLLYGAEIDKLNLSRLKLVILSACHTVERARDLEGGVSGLADAFLRAGTGGVIGSLWAADDEGTSALMVTMHQHLARGARPGEALRRAQVELLRTPDQRLRVRSPWAAFRFETR